MALSPNGGTRAVKITQNIKPSKTYSFDFDTGEVGGIIDGIDAIRQFVRKALATPRFRHLIYNSEYGSELETLIGSDVTAQLLQAEIPRIIREALIYDDRVKDVTDVTITRDRDRLYISFTVSTIEGVITEEVTV
jgi:phage baseplate assembly protein W